MRDIMLYADLAARFEELEATGSRLEMASILSDLFKGMDARDIRSVVYLSQGKLRPDFHGVELGMSDRLVLRSISSAAGVPLGKTEKLWIELGDPGLVAERLIAVKKQTTLFSEPLTLARVIRNLEAIESADGRDSQTKKTKLLAQLLHDSSPVEARFLCRIVTGRMRVGAGAMTILDALAEAFAGKEDRPLIERGYNITCDLGLIAETLATEGLEGVESIKVAVGSPLKVMLAERLPSVEQILERMGGRCAMEYKYDGIRVQAHISAGEVRLYSRRLEDLTSNFPDVAAALAAGCRVKDAIIEGECVAVDRDTGAMLPFQTVTHRRKKHGMEQAVRDIPVRIFMFDMVYADGEDLTARPYEERRRALAESFEIGGQVELTKMRVVGSVEEGLAFFNEALEDKCEGIMAKSLAEDSVYRAGSRGFLWVKYKRDYESALTDSFDLAVVGAFFGMGKRTGGYGALLMASFDEDTGMFCTVCKLGTGFDDGFLAGMPALLDDGLSETRPRSVDAKMTPDVWFEPTVVLEVVAAEISKSPVHTAASALTGDGSGLGLRFPRFTGRVRDDKEPDQCTSVQEIHGMYLLQDRGGSETGE